MAIPCSNHDREQAKFRECPEGSGETVVAVKVCDAPPVEVSATLDPDLPPGYSSLRVFNQISSLASGTETLILSYTVPADKELILGKIKVSGENKATYNLELNDTLIDVKRTYYTYYDNEFEFDRHTLSEGDKLDILVVNRSVPISADFESLIIGILKDV